MDPKDNIKIAEDFLLKVLTGYIVVAAREILKEESISLVGDLAERIIERYVWVLSQPLNVDTTDQILIYSTEVISLGLLWDNYHDTVREGDGHRIVLIWRFYYFCSKKQRGKTIVKRQLYSLLNFSSCFQLGK